MVITIIDTFVSEGLAYHAISVMGKKVVIQAYIEDNGPGNHLVAETAMGSELSTRAAMRAIRENDDSHPVQKMFRLAKEAHVATHKKQNNKTNA